MLLKKIDPDDDLKNKLGYFSEEEIKSENHGIDVLSHINDDLIESKPN